MTFLIKVRLIPNENRHAEYKWITRYGDIQKYLKSITVTLTSKEIESTKGILWRDKIANRLREMYNCEQIYDLEVEELKDDNKT